MGFSGVDNNIYSLNTIRPQFGRFTAKNPVTNPVKIPVIKDTFTNRKTAANDGKFSFLEFGKNIIKGTGQFFADIYHNIVNNPLIAVPLMVAGAAVAATPLGFAALAGFGVTAGVFSLVLLGAKAAKLISDNKWDELEKQGKNLGKIVVGTAISAIAAVKAVRQIEKITGVANVGKSAAIAKARSIGDSTMWNVTKNAVCAPFRAFTKHVLRKDKISLFGKEIKIDGIFFKPIKNDYQKFVTNLPKAKKSLFTEEEINYLNTPKVTDWVDWKFKRPIHAIAMGLKGRSGE